MGLLSHQLKLSMGQPINNMTNEDRNHFEDLLVKAVQSGKKETSDLVDSIMHKMDSKIEDSINKNVNGKILSLHNKVDAYIKEDNEWKLRAEPVVKAFENTSWLSSLIVQILKLLGLLGASVVAYMTIKEFLK